MRKHYPIERRKQMFVEFSLNFVGCNEVVELPDDYTEDDINMAYELWLQDQAAGWEYYDEELE